MVFNEKIFIILVFKDSPRFSSVIGFYFWFILYVGNQLSQRLKTLAKWGVVIE